MSDLVCKHCGSSHFVKNGKQKGHQNYFCKDCRRNFVPARFNQDRGIEKRLCVILYGSGKASLAYLARVFGVCPSTILNWVRSYMQSIPDPVVPADLADIELDEMWHYLHEKKEKYGFLKPLTGKVEKQSLGFLVDETRRPSSSFTRS